MKAIYCSKFLIVLLIFISTCELTLRISGKLRTYSEKNFNKYVSYYGDCFSNYLHFLWNPNDTFLIKQTEFEYQYITNKDGYINKKNLADCKADSTYIFLGDSFVFGVGAPQDSNVAILLQDFFYKSGLNYEVYNAGFAGMDPFMIQKSIDSVFLKQSFVKYIFSINISDLDDYIFRGGEERYKRDGTVCYKSPPNYEIFHKYSFIARAIIHGVLRMDYTLLTPNQVEKRKVEVVDKFTDLLVYLNEQVKNMGGELIVVFHPYPTMYSSGKSSVKWSENNYKYLTSIHEEIQRQGVRSFNLEPFFAQTLNSSNFLEYSWELDGHFNSKGYELYAKILLQEVFNEELTKAY